VREALDDAGVGFVSIGGVAAVLHGSTYITKDIDIAFSRERESDQRLAAARPLPDETPRGAARSCPSSSTLRGGAKNTACSSSVSIRQASRQAPDRGDRGDIRGW
jgi:hypothetical protein